MEEIPTPTSRTGSLCCLLLNGAAGVAGAAVGAFQAREPYGSGINAIPELRLAQTLIAGFLVGVGVAVAALRWRPQTEEWAGARPTTVLIVTSMLASFVLVWGSAYWFERLR